MDIAETNAATFGEFIPPIEMESVVVLANPKSMIVVGTVTAGTAVALGAFGAHWLSSAVQDWGLTAAEQARQLEIWETAVRYQMYHALALICCGIMARAECSRGLAWAAWLFTVGTIIFCGCLYALVFSGIKILGAIVPLGGVALIAGWIVLALSTGTSSAATDKT